MESLLNTAEKEFLRNNFRLAFELFSSLCELDQTGHSYFRLGIMYKEGKGIYQDYIKMKYYFEKAFPLLLKSNNNAEVWTDLGFLYRNGEVVQKDLNEAFKYYKLSAE